MFRIKNQLLLCLLIGCLSATAQCPTGVTTYTVTNNSGSNVPGSMARACQCVNTMSAIKTIEFNIPDEPTIYPAVQFIISAPNVLVNGNSQPGIVFDGSSVAGSSLYGLRIISSGTGTTVTGLTIQGFTESAGGNGIQVESNNITITGNTLNNNTIGINTLGGGTVLISDNSFSCNTTGINRLVAPTIPDITTSNSQRVKGTSVPNALIEIYLNDPTCTGVNCQGLLLLGNATADAMGNWEFMPPAGTLQGSTSIVATATVNGNNTSEFTGCALVVGCDNLQVNIAATDISCFGNTDGKATATATGFATGGAPTFSWSNDSITSTISKLAPGNYTVTVTDNAGCTDTETATINQPVALNVNFVNQNVGCFNGQNGKIFATPSGGTPPFTYKWSNNSMADSITGLPIGIYSLTVTDSRNCTIARNTQLTQPQQLIATTNAIAETAGGANDGMASAVTTGGTPPFTLVWSNNDTTTEIDELAPGSYTVTVTDRNGCTATATALIGAGPGGGPCSALPVYGLFGPSEVCGNTILKLEADDNTDASVQYWWYFPNGDSTVTDQPMLDLLVTSTDFSGEYFVVRDSAGCRSIPVGGLPVNVLSLDPGQIFAGTDSLVCAANMVVLRAQAPSQGTGMWVSLGSATIEDPADMITVARNLQTGANAFVWQVSLGNCTAAASDTVVYFLEKKAILNDDRYVLQYAQDIAVMEVLLNDALGGLPDTVVTQFGTPSAGILEYLEEGKRFRYTVEENFRGTVQFQYVVCSPTSACNLPCDTANVTIDIQNLPSVPEGLVVEDPGANGRLTIKGINGFTKVEIAIFDRWGSMVYEEKDYDNADPWLGYYHDKPLPDGAYYYYLKAYDGNILYGGTRTGVIHLFSNK